MSQQSSFFVNYIGSKAGSQLHLMARKCSPTEILLQRTAGEKRSYSQPVPREHGPPTISRGSSQDQIPNIHIYFPYSFIKIRLQPIGKPPWLFVGILLEEGGVLLLGGKETDPANHSRTW